MIVHVTTRAAWERAVAAGEPYRHPSLDTEGFVHCSTPDQVAATVARYFETTAGHVALVIDADRAGDVRWEPSTGGERFPHVYGPIPLDAVVDVRPLD